MRKLRKARTRSERNRSDSLIAAELLERRYAFTATPLLDQFTSAAMEAVARGELTSERWIVHKLDNNELSSEGSCQSLTNFGGNAGWHADPIGTSFFRLQTSGIDSSHVVDWARNNHEQFLIEPDLPIQVQRTPNDPSLWRLYGLHNSGQSGGTTDADLDALEAWEITTGSRDVVIGVIDSGVDINHPDLAANIWVNPGETPNNGIDDDGNGFVDDVNGWDFYDNDNTPNDGNGHGTHVAGTIGAVGNNNLGIAGVNWEVSILPLRFLGNDGSGWTSDAVAAVNYATMLKRDFDINVAATNNSWGGGGYSRTLDRAIEAANNQGIMFVAAAGNEGNNNDTNPRYPTNYDAPNVISVAALNRNDNLAGFSNYGATTVDVGAPGVSIYSTLPSNSYGSFSGTSMAAPHVAGVIGLLNAAKPGISVTEVTDAILGTVDTVQSLQGKTVSGGRVNAAAALSSILDQLPSVEPIDDLILSSGQIQSITVIAHGADDDVTLSFETTNPTEESSPVNVTLDDATLTLIADQELSGVLEVTVTATDSDGNSAFESFSVEVLTSIESEGSVVLSSDAAGRLYANGMSIQDQEGKHISTSHWDGWETRAAETVDGVNNVLWEYTPTGKIRYWNTNESWNWTSSFGEYYDGSVDYYLAETRFGIDVNQDGTLGRPEQVLTSIESEGSVVLSSDAAGRLYANGMSIQDQEGKHISTSHWDGWETRAAETVDGVNNVLWEYTPTGKIRYWNTNESWNWTSSFGEYYDGSVDYYLAETRFGIDVNQDGTLGRPEQVLTSIESEGSVVLSSDAAGRLYANGMSIQDQEGKHISTSHWDGWETRAAETVDGVNNVLWEYTPTGKIRYWNTNESWNWTSSFGEYYDGSVDYYLAETRFGIDVNQDGTLGRPEQVLTSIESEGSVVLSSDAAGRLYANGMSIQDQEGKHISTSHWDGWETRAAETVDGVNNVLWEYTPTGKIRYWNTNESWNWTSSFGEYYDGSVDYYLAETRFGIDVNQDGTLGRPEQVLTSIESEGSVVLSSDAAGRLYANGMSIQDQEGKHISTSHWDGWETRAAETVDGVNNVLWEYTPTGKIRYWNTNESWNWTSSFGEYYDGSVDYYLAETRFGIDVNQDGVIGKPITTDLQDFPSELLPGTSVVDLPVGYETSGLTWHQGLEKIFSVSDEGIVSMMNEDGANLVHWNIGGDLEAITVADHTSNFIYIGVENPDSVIEFDISSGQITRTFSLTGWMTGPSNLGLEALTFVPDATHPEGGVFYAGLQSTGEVFRFGLSIKSSSTLSSVTFIDTIVIEGSHADLADLSYDPSSDRILALYDSLDHIKVIEKDGELWTQWVAPGTEQEAILYVGGKLFIGEDFGGSSRGTITQFSPFTSIVA